MENDCSQYFIGKLFKIKQKLKNQSKLDKIGENSWQLLYYTISFCIGLSVILGTNEIMDLPEVFLIYPYYVSSQL